MPMTEAIEEQPQSNIDFPPNKPKLVPVIKRSMSALLMLAGLKAPVDTNVNLESELPPPPQGNTEFTQPVEPLTANEARQAAIATQQREERRERDKEASKKAPAPQPAKEKPGERLGGPQRAPEQEQLKQGAKVINVPIVQIAENNMQQLQEVMTGAILNSEEWNSVVIDLGLPAEWTSENAEGILQYILASQGLEPGDVLPELETVTFPDGSTWASLIFRTTKEVTNIDGTVLPEGSIVILVEDPQDPTTPDTLVVRDSDGKGNDEIWAIIPFTVEENGTTVNVGRIVRFLNDGNGFFAPDVVATLNPDGSLSVHPATMFPGLDKLRFSTGSTGERSFLKFAIFNPETASTTSVPELVPANATWESLATNMEEGDVMRFDSSVSENIGGKSENGIITEINGQTVVIGTNLPGITISGLTVETLQGEIEATGIIIDSATSIELRFSSNGQVDPGDEILINENNMLVIAPQKSPDGRMIRKIYYTPEAMANLERWGVAKSLSRDILALLALSGDSSGNSWITIMGQQEKAINEYIQPIQDKIAIEIWNQVFGPDMPFDQFHKDIVVRNANGTLTPEEQQKWDAYQQQSQSALSDIKTFLTLGSPSQPTATISPTGKHAKLFNPESDASKFLPVSRS